MWRDVASSNPALWKRISFNLNQTGRYMYTHHEETTISGWNHQAKPKRWTGRRVQRYLDYRADIARDHSLSLYLRGSLVECFGKTEFFTLIRGFAPRLQSLHLEIEGDSVIELDRHPLAFPLLEKLVLSLENLRLSPIQPMLEPLERVFMNTPRLQHVIADSGTFTNPIVFPWNQLVNFEGHKVTTGAAWHLLTTAKTCSNAASASLTTELAPPI
ncbi:hypothetical protein B0H16DRAFT_60567 [Mycena metata]|uniref:Uncharacterized protein n=1 Tax=Mycena metata TaxID=1033252 RepID=A0AAD7IC80_9AGAR|nr:hypothetical protein B0H16DRAFT_60567 [Mycena metata]